MPTYNKLVRDAIPDVISQTGKEFRTSTVTGETLLTELKKKLLEEAEEFVQSSNDPAELADVLEVMEALAAAMELDWETLRQIQADKRVQRGGFQKGIFLEWVED